VKKLFGAVDWIGVSAYAGLPRFPSVADLETSLKLVDQEMKMFGMDLKGLGKEIIYSEYGECTGWTLVFVGWTSWTSTVLLGAC
jgi:hypothetical protein